MKLHCLTLALLAGLSARAAQAEHDGSPTVDATDTSAADAAASATAVLPQENGDSRSPTAAVRGELVRLSKLPEAELMVDVKLQSNDPLAYFEVISDKTGASLLICDSACRFRIWPGRYRLMTNASEGYVGGSNFFVVDRSSTVQVAEPGITRPILGAILGSIGVAGTLVGGFLVATNICEHNCPTSTSVRHQIGIASVGAGLVLSLTGWTLYAQSRSPSVTVQPTELGRSE